MASGKAKSIDDMTMRELLETMEVLGVSDEEVETRNDARSRIRTALNEAEKTTLNWSPGEVRYLLVKFQNRHEFGRRSLVCFKRSDIS